MLYDEDTCTTRGCDKEQEAQKAVRDGTGEDVYGSGNEAFG